MRSHYKPDLRSWSKLAGDHDCVKRILQVTGFSWITHFDLRLLIHVVWRTGPLLVTGTTTSLTEHCKCLCSRVIPQQRDGDFWSLYWSKLLCVRPFRLCPQSLFLRAMGKIAPENLPRRCILVCLPKTGCGSCPSFAIPWGSVRKTCTICAEHGQRS